MTEFDRTDLLKALDDRHEELLEQLESLNAQIEAALAYSRPETSSPPTPTATGAATAARSARKS